MPQPVTFDLELGDAVGELLSAFARRHELAVAIREHGTQLTNLGIEPDHGVTLGPPRKPLLMRLGCLGHDRARS
ncbi:MAG: hypothetical protein FD127_593 [Acidimicrobiaceae bacterium]|nr:MAG: hypothetical protein FD127_593 [Acidimicrobiaceae bacterium]